MRPRWDAKKTSYFYTEPYLSFDKLTLDQAVAMLVFEKFLK